MVHRFGNTRRQLERLIVKAQSGHRCLFLCATKESVLYTRNLMMHLAPQATLTSKPWTFTFKGGGKVEIKSPNTSPESELGGGLGSITFDHDIRFPDWNTEQRWLRVARHRQFKEKHNK